jgi:hypothetical protein
LWINLANPLPTNIIIRICLYFRENGYAPFIISKVPSILHSQLLPWRRLIINFISPHIRNIFLMNDYIIYKSSFICFWLLNSAFNFSCSVFNSWYFDLKYENNDYKWYSESYSSYLSIVSCRSKTLSLNYIFTLD